MINTLSRSSHGLKESPCKHLMDFGMQEVAKPSDVMYVFNV